jgi:competence protein ComEA
LIGDGSLRTAQGHCAYRDGSGCAESNHLLKRRMTMKSFALMLQSLVLSALLAGTALAAEKVNINTADAATLDRVLVGVGPSKAEAIVAYRKQNGAFKSADQLVSVKGIGLATVEKNRDRIVVNAAPAAPAQAKPAVAQSKAPAPSAGGSR